MLKYLENIKNTLKSLKMGVEKHTAQWDGQAETPDMIGTKIDTITQIQQEIETLKNQLTQKKKQARKIQKEINLVVDTIKKKALGFHLAKPELLNDYDIKPRKHHEKAPRLVATQVIAIKDNPSDKGFVLSTKRTPHAEHYEWQRGISSNPKDISNIPPMQFYKSTSKSGFTDEEIEVGERYFYRVRACNRSGDGPWSAVSSRVQ